MRTRYRLVALATCLLALPLLGGCAAASQPQPLPRSSTAPISASGSSCGRPVVLHAGMTVGSWRLGSVHFLSPAVGVALTAAQVPCRGPDGITIEPETVMLASTSDGGRQWITRGMAFPSGQQSPVFEQITAFSTQDIWALTNVGKVYGSGNGGRSWTLQPLPVSVTTMLPADGQLLALNCPAPDCDGSVYQLLPGHTAWQRVPLPKPATELVPVTAGRVLVLTSVGASLTSKLIGSKHWRNGTIPSGSVCADGLNGLLTAASATDWWLLCTNGAAAGSSTKALLHTENAGRTWQVTSALTTLGAVRPGSLPASGANDFTALSPTLLVIACANVFVYSTDAGVTWHVVPAINPQGAFGSFDTVPGAGTWFIADGAGLWHTTNGTQWTAVGSAFFG
jgi:hypothetical protein